MLLLFAAAALLAVAILVPAQAMTPAVLKGEVGPGFTIEVTKGGKDVKSLKAGKYTIKVEDKSASHNFRLKGPGGINKATTVPFKGKKTWTVTLKKGKYTYQCDPHASSGMKDTFTVK